MKTKPDALHHERKNTALYAHDDHRVHPEHCRHTRFWDKVFPLTGTCMDCGHEIWLGRAGQRLRSAPPWSITGDADPLSDEELASERARYNAFWIEYAHRGNHYTALHTQAISDGMSWDEAHQYAQSKTVEKYGHSLVRYGRKSKPKKESA